MARIHTADTAPDRGLSPVIGTVLVVGVTLLLAVTIGTVALAVTTGVTDPPPTAVVTAGRLAPHAAPTGGVVTLTHRVGTPIRTEELAIVVDATDACGKRGRLHALPLGAGNDIDPSNVAGADVFDERSVRRFGDPPYPTLTDRWRAGGTLTLRVPYTDCPIASGERLVVSVVHTPTTAVLARFSLVAHVPGE